MLLSKQFIKPARLSKILYSFSKKKRDDAPDPLVRYERQKVEIQEKYKSQSAALYDHYIKLIDRPLLTLDNYQIAYTVILQRTAIFMPYKAQHFDYLKTKYQTEKKVKRSPEIPKELQIDRPQFLFAEYERVNPENTISHRNTISKTEIYEYAEKSRYWRYSDPTIQDPKSIQTFGAENVFFITKDHSGEWKFPSRIISEKDKHTQIFTLIGEDLFGGGNNPILHFEKKKPIYAKRIEKDDLDRGVGIQQMFFRGYSINGIPKFPTQRFADYAWVPKPHFSKYFSKEYLKQIAPLTIHAY